MWSQNYSYLCGVINLKPNYMDKNVIILDDILIRNMPSIEFEGRKGVMIKNAMITFGSELLKLAYENAITSQVSENGINEKSITRTINKVKV